MDIPCQKVYVWRSDYRRTGGGNEKSHVVMQADSRSESHLKLLHLSLCTVYKILLYKQEEKIGLLGNLIK